MNEEYLWDKNGTDAEIERLEELLSPMRYVPTPPPSLKAEEARSFRWLASWFSPTAGALAAAGLLLAVGTGWQLAKLRSGNEHLAANEPAPAVTQPSSPSRAESVPAPAAVPRASDEIRVTNALHVPARRAVRQLTVSARKPRPRRHETEITKEELKAYEQVMLALSIASDKLKIVSEAAKGTDD